jgi:hypothetical protein
MKLKRLQNYSEGLQYANESKLTKILYVDAVMVNSRDYHPFQSYT